MKYLILSLVAIALTAFNARAQDSLLDRVSKLEANNLALQQQLNSRIDGVEAKVDAIAAKLDKALGAQTVPAPQPITVQTGQSGGCAGDGGTGMGRRTPVRTILKRLFPRLGGRRGGC